MKRAVTLRSLALEDSLGGDVQGESSPTLAQRRRDRQISTAYAIFEDCKHWLRSAWAFATSKTGQGIFKCSLAYLLGCMATFVPFIAAWLGEHQDGKHMVATVTVYFHPARTQGSMFEAVGLAILCFIYMAFISFTSMGASIFFGRTLGLLAVGHIVVLIVFCGGGLGFVGWVKQRLGNPLVNVACSLTSLGVITVLTKEGAVQAAEFSDDKVIQVMQMIIMGVVAATAVCFIVKPVSARNELRENMIQVTDSLGDMLAMITRSFLTGSEEELEQRAFVIASDRYRKVFTSLSKNLREAKFEHYIYGTETEYHLEAKLVKCMQRMAQNIGGLRSAATTQFDLLAQGPAGGATPVTSIYTPISALSPPTMGSWLQPQEAYGVLTAIHENPEEEDTSRETPDMAMQNDLPTIRSPVDIFERFIIQLGPSMVCLSLIGRGQLLI